MNNLVVTKTSKILGVDKKKIKVIERLLGGMSNYMFVVEVDKVKYTLRVPGKGANNFVDRKLEKRNIKTIENIGLNNQTIYIDEDGYKLAKYVEGVCLLNIDIQSKLGEIGDILRKLHNSGLKSDKDYDCLKRLYKYENLLKDKNYQGERKEYYSLKKKLTSDFNYLNEKNKVFCHGDSQLSNFVSGSDKMYLLDWEFAGNNDPLYDIACFGNRDFDDALKLLPVYLGRKPTSTELSKLNFYRGFQCLQWHNVAIYKYLIGLDKELNVPFFEVATEYLVKAKYFLKESKKSIIINSNTNFENCNLFKDLDKTTMSRLKKNIYKEEIKAGTMMYNSGVCNGVMLIKEGKCRVYMVSETGREITLFYIKKGETLALSMNCIGGSMPIDIKVSAEQDSVLLRINSKEFRKIHKESFELQKFLVKNITEKMNEILWIVEQVVFKNMDNRVANYLLRLNSRIIYNTHKEIGNDLGTAREVISRILKYFEKLELVEIGRGKIRIINREGLEKIGGKT